MPLLTLENLITDTGEVDSTVYEHMVRRRAMNEHGGLSPRAIREAAEHYAMIIPVLIAHRLAQQVRHG